jgi:hypothetical protein
MARKNLRMKISRLSSNSVHDWTYSAKLIGKVIEVLWPL